MKWWCFVISYIHTKSANRWLFFNIYYMLWFINGIMWIKLCNYRDHMGMFYQAFDQMDGSL